jgi:hypothetical protein
MKPSVFPPITGKKLLLTVLISLALCLTLPVSSAEHEWDHRYTITGTVTDANGEIATDTPVFLDCSPENANQNICGHNEGRNSTTDNTGSYSLELHIHSNDHDSEIYLLVENKSFRHVLDLEGDNGQAEEGDRTTTMNIDLSAPSEQKSMSNETILIGVSLVLVLILIMMMAINFRKSDTDTTKDKTFQNRTDLLSCPKCDTKLKDTNLIGHLMKRHFYSQSDAEEELKNQTLP